MIRIGVDLGGTKIEAIAIDAQGRELSRKRVPTPPGDYADTVEAVRRLVRDLESALGVEQAPVGVGTPGSISPTTGLIRNANSTRLNDRPLAVDLAAALDREVRVANDANCFALSEAVDGAGAGARTVFGIILGTGVGGGLVLEGRLWTGVNAIEGEWGHNEMPARTEDRLPPMRCYCGRTNCIETYLAGPRLAEDHLRAAGEALGAPEIAAHAQAGDANAAATLARYCNRLASALSVVINIVDPEVIVVGGGVSNIEAIYPAVTALLPRHVFSDRCTTRVLKNLHGDSSGVRGAAWLWPADTAPDSSR